MARNENTSTIFWQMRDSQNSSIPVQKRLIRCYLLQKVLPISKAQEAAMRAMMAQGSIDVANLPRKVESVYVLKSSADSIDDSLATF